ncbi:MAG: ribonuclease III [Oscillospiraceae bacterium]|nr:ribonuclease III [Oscillospiraceae bacterium]
MLMAHEPLTKNELGALSALALAHTGDAVYELLVRAWLVSCGKATNGSVHKETVARVSAPAQSAALERLMPLLSEEEQAVYRRGRNAHVHAIPKNATHEQYAKATGLEALFGYLYLSGREERCLALFTALTEEDHAL